MLRKVQGFYDIKVSRAIMAIVELSTPCLECFEIHINLCEDYYFGNVQVRA